LASEPRTEGGVVCLSAHGNHPPMNRASDVTAQSSVTMTDFYASFTNNNSSSSSSSGDSPATQAAIVTSRLETGSAYPFSIDAIIGDVTSSSSTNHFRTRHLNTGT